MPGRPKWGRIAVANVPSTAHMLGGAVIGTDRSSGVVDRQLRVFGYQNLLVCDGSAMPANPGVNPALTITALAEYAMAQIGQKALTARPNLGRLGCERGDALAPAFFYFTLSTTLPFALPFST